jgi:CRISPR/Cas system-associated endoribonuclease Cas2
MKFHKNFLPRAQRSVFKTSLKSLVYSRSDAKRQRSTMRFTNDL